MAAFAGVTLSALLTLGGGGWAAVGVAGCVVETGVAAPPNGIAADGPPPQPVTEAPPPPPSGRNAWVPGYWHWTGMQYTWIPGHWESAPPGARWRAPRYTVREGTYFYEPGGWGRAP